MENLRTQKIRAEAHKLLVEGKVDVVIGFKKGSLPSKMQPFFAGSVEEIEQLELNGLCSNNLAVYLNHRPRGERTAIICRGCESRAIQTLVLENRHARENLTLIGVPCIGILDGHKIEQKLPGSISSITEEEGQVVVESGGVEIRFDRLELLHDACLHCEHPDPVNVDVMIDEAGWMTENSLDKSYCDAFRMLDIAQRYEKFSREAERCIRCYACREACPMCYCEECFVDHSRPRWIESTVERAGQQAWHIIRAFHQTGRCVSCGACERACPMEIKMTYLTDLLNQDMKRDYGFEPGMTADQVPPFAALSEKEEQYFHQQDGDHVC
ncbi:MAG: 4Fe-4S dicluster domain-containing protein [Chloroflexi bacterium]|nr:4Fe-4S dicluster domain-containing protein [Chloroflexota bacterium]